MSEQIIVFGIFFDESAKKEYGSLTNLVRHTFKSHFDEYNGQAKRNTVGNEMRGAEEIPNHPGPSGSQVIQTDPKIQLYWRNYKPGDITNPVNKDVPEADELFLNVAMDRFLSDNRFLTGDPASMSVLNQFKNHIVEMIKERDERKRQVP